MARTVNPEQHAARRTHIIDAALTRFAADGYDGATTAEICRTAGIGSGTFFHYFPTKADVLLAILELGTAEAREWFTARDDRADPLEVLRAWTEHMAEDFADPRMPGFVRAVSAVMTDPLIARALAADDAAQRDGLLPWVRRAQDAHQVRTDLPAERLVNWLFLVVDGYAGQLAGGHSFSSEVESRMLVDAVERMLMHLPGHEV